MKEIKIIESVSISEEQRAVGWDDKTKKVYVNKGIGTYITEWIDILKDAETEEEAKLMAIDFLLTNNL
jgi:hypothetical protein